MERPGAWRGCAQPHLEWPPVPPSLPPSSILSQISPAWRAPGPAGNQDLVSRACAHPGSQGRRMPAASGLGTARWVGARLLVSRKYCGCLGLVGFVVWTPPGAQEHRGCPILPAVSGVHECPEDLPITLLPLGVSNARAGPCPWSMALLPSTEQDAWQGLRGSDCE